MLDLKNMPLFRLMTSTVKKEYKEENFVFNLPDLHSSDSNQFPNIESCQIHVPRRLSRRLIHLGRKQCLCMYTRDGRPTMPCETPMRPCPALQKKSKPWGCNKKKTM